jgi:beta-glucosidase
MTPDTLSFPKAFIWGVATAAPQIEGAAFTDGKTASTWDHFARQPGRVHNNENLDVACDHYHRFDADFALMAKLGVKNYRLSLAWPRIITAADGAVNQAGLDFYHRLFDSLEKHGITPWVTLFHWDTPQYLEPSGGWRNRATAEAFGRYAEVIVKTFGSRVKNWITINELRNFTTASYSGALDKAPGVAASAQENNQAVHHALLAHGYAVRAVRAHGGPGARVGISNDPDIFVPIEETPEHIAAARAAFAACIHNDRIHGTITRGAYSAAYLSACGPDAPLVAPSDLELIGQATDFLGLNVYTGTFVRAADNASGYEVLPFPKGYPATTFSGWLRTVPQAIYWGPRLAAEVYGVKAITITENGYGAVEETDANGEILDLHRRDYLRQYLLELRRAISDGVPVKGYFCWSFMDNFEWQDGYSIRFGLVHTDYPTQKRTPKLSAKWYSRVITENRIV